MIFFLRITSFLLLFYFIVACAPPGQLNVPESYRNLTRNFILSDNLKKIDGEHERSYNIKITPSEDGLVYEGDISGKLKYPSALKRNMRPFLSYFKAGFKRPIKEGLKITFTVSHSVTWTLGKSEDGSYEIVGGSKGENTKMASFHDVSKGWLFAGTQFILSVKRITESYLIDEAKNKSDAYSSEVKKFTEDIFKI